MVIAVLCVSRGNPQALFEALVSFHDTTMNMGTSHFVAVLDENDPMLPKYIEMLENSIYDLLVVPTAETGYMNLALNYAALIYAEKADVVGFIGDDHRFRTKGWDRIVGKVLSDIGGGFVYADDLAQRSQLPTQVFVSSPVIKALGWMGLPGCRHLYLDNAWKFLGETTDSLYYLPDIVIEHMHPAYGKGTWDDNHTRVNSADFYSHDREVYDAWIARDARADVEKVRATLRPA